MGVVALPAPRSMLVEWNDGLNAGLRHETPGLWPAALCARCVWGVRCGVAQGQSLCCSVACADGDSACQRHIPLGRPRL